MTAEFKWLFRLCVYKLIGDVGKGLTCAGVD